MDKSDIQETLVHLYLRLNGYFSIGYIVHAVHGVATELDVLAVRFPRYEEPEREILCSTHLTIPTDRIDFVVGEVKGGANNVNFNAKFRQNPDAVRSTLQRFGAFSCGEIDRAVKSVPELLHPNQLRRARSFPEIQLSLWGDESAHRATLRFIPFATEQARVMGDTRPYIFQDDIIGFVWDCFRPERRRVLCDVRYNFELWGPQFEQIVQYFKDAFRTTPGTIEDLYDAYGLCRDVEPQRSQGRRGPCRP